MSIGDRSWVAAVRAACDPVFDQADAGFAFNASVDSGAEVVTSLLWEASPRRFIERYPDSDILDSNGVEDADEIHCLDFWVYLEGDGAQISAEGWDHLDITVPLTGSGGTDGSALAAVFADRVRVSVDPA